MTSLRSHWQLKPDSNPVSTCLPPLFTQWHLPQTHTQGCYFSQAGLEHQMKCGPAIFFHQMAPLTYLMLLALYTISIQKKIPFSHPEFWTHLRKQIKPFRPKEEGCWLPATLCLPHTCKEASPSELMTTGKIRHEE